MKTISFFLMTLLLLISCEQGGSGSSLTKTPNQQDVQRALDKKFCLENSTNTPFASGDGTESNPYKICTISHFNEISASNSYLDKSFELFSNLDFSNSIIDLIGANPGGFSGDFDGRNYKLSNVNISESGVHYVGVFRRIEASAVVKNLILDNITVVGANYTAALVGYSAGTIDNVQASGSVQGGSNTGGLVGRVWVGSAVLGVYNSTSTVTVNGGQWTGGLVGWSRGATYDGNSSSGDVTGSNRTGGLIGVADGSTIVKNSFATGDVHAPSFIVGGLIGGIASGTIENCYSTGAVTSNDSWIGGLVGTLDGTVTKSYSTSSVTTPGDSVGGIAGYLYPNGGISNSYYAGAINANDYVGGIVGYTDGSPITHSFSTATITANTAGGIQGGSTGAVSATSFWDTDTSGVSGDFIDDMVTTSTDQARTTVQMKSASMYNSAGYDNTIWEITDGSYPTLK